MTLGDFASVQVPRKMAANCQEIMASRNLSCLKDIQTSSYSRFGTFTRFSGCSGVNDIFRGSVPYLTEIALGYLFRSL